MLTRLAWVDLRATNTPTWSPATAIAARARLRRASAAATWELQIPPKRAAVAVAALLDRASVGSRERCHLADQVLP